LNKAVLSQADALVEVPLLDLEPVHRPLRTELREAVNRILDSNRFIGGPEIESFEREMADYCQVSHAVGVSSGTDALVVSLMAYAIGYGDEVIVPSFTFFSTAGSVRRLGAVPVFCDIEPRGFNLDPEKLSELISPRTKAVIPVHLFGQCADMDSILQICRAHSLAVIEDAAQAVGARYRGKMAGSMGDVGCFSFSRPRTSAASETEASLPPTTRPWPTTFAAFASTVQSVDIITVAWEAISAWMPFKLRRCE